MKSFVMIAGESMDLQQLGQVGPPSEKTERNIRKARCRSLWVGPVHLEWKLWTGSFLFFPKWQSMTTEFWNEGPVRWFRFYWLTFGLSMYKPLPELRHKPRGRS